MLLQNVTSATVMPRSIAASRSDSSGEGELEPRRSRNSLGSEVGGPERLRDDHIRIGQVLVEGGVLTVFVGRHHKLVAEPLQIEPKTEFTRDAAQQ
jgi:hypothetical protein